MNENNTGLRIVSALVLVAVLEIPDQSQNPKTKGHFPNDN